MAIGFSQSTGLPWRTASQHVVVMQSVRAGDEHGIDLRTGAQFGGRGEGVVDSKLLRRFLCPLQIATRQGRDPAAAGLGESRHQAFHRVQTKSDNAKSNHSFVPCTGW